MRNSTIGLGAPDGGAFQSGEAAEDWLSGMDSNHDKLLQRELCYRYTTGQADL